jgi:hypothetical protein
MLELGADSQISSTTVDLWATCMSQAPDYIIDETMKPAQHGFELNTS